MPVITIGTNPTPIWSVAAQGSGSLLLVNLDSAANITVGDASVTPFSAGAQTIPPQGAMSIPANQAWYAVSDLDTQPELQLTVGGGDWAASPAGIARAMIAVGIPALIAEELSNSGVSLIAAPKQLYNIGGVQAPGTGLTSLVGWTVPNMAFNAGCYYQNLAGPNEQDQGDSAFQANVHRGLSNNRVPVTKKFWNPGDYHTSNNFNNLVNYYNYGTLVIICLQPLFNASNHVPASEITALNNFLTAITALGATPTNTIIVLWQEPGILKNGVPKATNIQYQNGWADCGPTIAAAGFPMVPNVQSVGGSAKTVGYYNSAFASGVTFAGIAQDYYAGSYSSGIRLDDSAAVADAHAVPFGIFEFGVAPVNFPNNPNISAQYLGYIQSFFQARQAASKPNLHFVWYDGQCHADGAGDLTAPILTPTDPRVPLYQAIFDTLTVSPTASTAGLTIPASSTKVVGPLDPSPVGNLAHVTELSYEIAFGLTAGAASTIPFARVIATWYEFDQLASNQTPIEIVGFFVPMGTNGDANGPLVIRGRGRQRGQYMTIKVVNLDTVDATLTFLQFMDNGRIGSRDSWVWDINNSTSPNVPGFTRANAGNGSLEVGRVTSQTVNQGQTKSWLCGLFAGRVSYKISTPTGTTGNNVTFKIAPQPASIFTGSPTYLQEVLGAAGNTNQRGELIFTRDPVLVTVENNEPVNNITASFVINAEETG